MVCCVVGLGCSSSPRFVEKGGEKKSTVPEKSSPEKATVQTGGKVLLTLEGVASYYANDFHGKLTSNGEVFDMNSLTAAHRTFPFGTKIRVTNLENGQSVVVRVNDRGPFKEGRIIDLALGAAKEINLVKTGTARVRLEVLEWGDGK
jgi:rare lipoprotein A